ncbi:unnamed protein product [Clonostachys solani]|uniref:DUF7137 domain-containing protein n=1 Tax=Clonostachys solani TaxID=160281 RepID=A0A9N9W5G4_9HYPO|nr:unnamed protein product [Clonostachys solani]
MRPTRSVVKLALCLYAMAPLASAWPQWMPERDSLYVRADDDKSSAASQPASVSATATGEASKTAGNSLNTAKPEESEAEQTGSQTGSQTGGSKTTSGASGSSKGTDSAKKTTYGNTIYAGGVKMLTPDPTKTPSALFKIGDTVTLGWNYTDVKAAPTAVDVLLSCKSKSATWTLTGNMTYETKAEYIWDTNKQANDGSNPLGTDQYTLVIKDSESHITDSPQPGYLNAASALTFGLYTPQAYTPYADWKCNACSSAPPTLDLGAVKLAMTMSLITLLSFTWFVAGL